MAVLAFRLAFPFSSSGPLHLYMWKISRRLSAPSSLTDDFLL